MSKAQAPAPSLLQTRRVFAPARHAQHFLASAYLQLLPSPRPVPVRPGRHEVRPTSAARTAAAS